MCYNFKFLSISDNESIKSLKFLSLYMILHVFFMFSFILAIFVRYYLTFIYLTFVNSRQSNKFMSVLILRNKIYFCVYKYKIKIIDVVSKLCCCLFY